MAASMTSASLVILADDLTGATDAAVQFAKLGARTDVWLDRPGMLSDCDVAAIDTNTRALPSAAAAECLRALLAALPRDVALLKKVDSTLRGNIAAETEALLAARDGSIAIVVPAHPKNGRVQRAGRVLVDGIPVHETDFGRDLFAPVRFSDVRRHLPERDTALLAAPSASDPVSFADAFAAAVRGGARTIAIDAETQEDLAAIAGLAEEAAGRYVWVGSAGFLEALAPVLLRARLAENGRPAVSTAALVEPVLFVIGSLSAMTRRQIACFAESGGVTEMIDPRTVLIDEGGSRARESTHRIEKALAAGSDVLVALSSDREDVEAALTMGRLHGFDGPTTSRELRERFVELVEPALAKAGSVVLSGADVARTFFVTTGITGIRLLGEAVVDIPFARALDRDVLVVTKAGGSGTPETYRDIAREAKARSGAR